MQISHDFIATKNFPKNDKSAFGSNASDQESQTFFVRGPHKLLHKSSKTGHFT